MVSRPMPVEVPHNQRIFEVASSSHPTAQDTSPRRAQATSPECVFCDAQGAGVVCSGTMHVKQTWRRSSAFFLLERNGTLSQFSSHAQFCDGARPTRAGRVLFVLFPETAPATGSLGLYRPREMLIGTSHGDSPWLVQVSSSEDRCKWINALWWSLDKASTPRKSAVKALMDYYGMAREAAKLKAPKGARRKSLLLTNDSFIAHKGADGSLKLRSVPPEPEPCTPCTPATHRVHFAKKLVKVREFAQLPRDEMRSLFYTQVQVYNMRCQACRPFDLWRARASEWLGRLMRPWRRGHRRATITHQVVPEQ